MPQRTFTLTPQRQWVASSTGLPTSHLAHSILSEGRAPQQYIGDDSVAGAGERVRLSYGNGCA
eukprot:6184104-Pleurochrysis_carterae.AAC.2